MQGQIRKWYGVQYLRALAATAVVAFHTLGLFSTDPANGLLLYGDYGVDLFFVISGFIITLTATRETAPAYFFARRLIRIVPLYWLITLAYLTIDILAPNLLRSGQTSFMHVMCSLLFLPSFHPAYPTEIWPLVIPGWSLVYEMFFYLICTGVLIASAKFQGLLAAGIITALIIVGMLLPNSNPVLTVYTNPRLCQFVFGIIVAQLYLGQTRDAVISLILMIMLWVGSVLLDQSDHLYSMMLIAALSSLILFALVRLEASGWLFQSKALAKIGDASYSIYLTHFAVIGATRHLLVHFSSLQTLPPLMLLFIVVAASVAVGCMVYVLVEQPIIDVFKTLLRRFGIRTTVQTAEHTA